MIQNLELISPFAMLRYLRTWIFYVVSGNRKKSHNTEFFTAKENSVVEHFRREHTRDSERRFIVPLSWKPNAAIKGETRTQAVKCFTIWKDLPQPGKIRRS